MSLDELIKDAEAFKAKKSDAIKGCKQLIEAFGLLPSDLFPSTALAAPVAVATPSMDAAKSNKEPRDYYYVKATKKVWFPAGVAGKNPPDGITHDDKKKIVADPDKITVIKAIDIKEAKAKAAALA